MINRKYLVLIPLLTFVGLLLAGLYVSVVSLKAVTTEEWHEMASMEKILSGESTKRFTKLLNQHFVLGKTFSQIQRGINWNLTGDLGPSVRAGCDDWLFLTDELEVYPGGEDSAAFRADIVAQLSARLKERGITLVVAVVPDKTRIESEKLCGLRRPAQFEQRIANWLGRIRQSGAVALDLTPPLQAGAGENYYRTDTHWNENGANSAAFYLASGMAELRLSAVPDASAVQLNAVKVERAGDLVHLAGLDGLPRALRPPVEKTSVTEVAPVSVESDDLFGDAGLPSIALVGTSYARNANFIPFLEHYLNEPVANLALDGGDFSGSATSYFAGAGFRDSPPKVVIWEVPERMLEKPVTEAERKWKTQLDSGKL